MRCGGQSNPVSSSATYYVVRTAQNGDQTIFVPAGDLPPPNAEHVEGGLGDYKGLTGTYYVLKNNNPTPPPRLMSAGSVARFANDSDHARKIMAWDLEPRGVVTRNDSNGAKVEEYDKDGGKGAPAPVRVGDRLAYTERPGDGSAVYHYESGDKREVSKDGTIIRTTNSDNPVEPQVKSVAWSQADKQWIVNYDDGTSKLAKVPPDGWAPPSASAPAAPAKPAETPPSSRKIVIENVPGIDRSGKRTNAPNPGAILKQLETFQWFNDRVPPNPQIRMAAAQHLAETAGPKGDSDKSEIDEEKAKKILADGEWLSKEQPPAKADTRNAADPNSTNDEAANKPAVKPAGSRNAGTRVASAGARIVPTNERF